MRSPPIRRQNEPVIVEVVEFTDPRCSWAWGTEPKHRRLRWRYGDRFHTDFDSDVVHKAFAADREETRRPNEYVLTLQETHEGKGNAKPDGDGWRYVFPTLLFRGLGGEHTVPGWQPWDAYVDAME